MQPSSMPSAIRAFGRVEDLDLEFTSADRPNLVTQLLAQCAGGDVEYWWTQPAGTRIAELLHLFVFSERTDHLELSARCLRAECGVTFGFELPLGEVASRAPRDESWEIVLPDDRRVRLRAPTGSDLRRWRSAAPATREQARRMMLDDLVVHGRFEASDVAAIANALLECDPLVAFTVTAECPGCGHAQEVAVDVEGLVLMHLGSRQRALIHDVHRLATHYGWTEPQVLAVPPQRRAVYLALLDREAG